VEKIADLAFVKGIIRKHKFPIKKRLGQNFLINSKILDKITDAAEVIPEDIVVEIGPGLGALTQSLASKKSTVLAVELDQGILPILTEHMEAYPNVKIINKDILEVDLDRLVKEQTAYFKPYKVVANLPYYITTPIVMYLLERRFNIDSIVIMVQKEVAERMAAQPGKKL
jgi:16S rRNA (adenine1518-N6/adenine1519-N6)-dimethyltransferase